MAQAGLNVATQAGEGDAYIMNWNEFDNTINQLYARDAANLKNVQALSSKMSIKLADSAKGIRPADMENFKHGYDKFMQASTMLNSREVMNNPQKMAYWRKEQEDAYYNNLSLAQQSLDAQKFQSTMWEGIAKDPTKYKDYSELEKINHTYENASVDSLKKFGLNTALPWMRPANAYPAQEFDQHILGKPLQKEQRTPIKDDKTGLIRGYWVNQTQTYTKTPSQIAKDVAFGFQQVPDAAAQWNNKFNYDLQNQPDVVRKTMEDAQAVLDNDPSNKGYKLGSGYADYAAANFIVQSQPRDIGDKKYETSDEWKEHEKDVDKQEDRSFRAGLAATMHGYRMQEADHRAWLNMKKQNNLGFSGQEIYDAANNPKQTYQVKQGNKVLSMNGSQLLDKRMSEIMSKVPNYYDYVILNRYNLLNSNERRRIVDKLFGNSATGNALRKLGGTDNTQYLEQFLTVLNKGIGTNMNVHDLDASTPVIVNKNKGTISAVSPSINNYDQFVSQIAQLVYQGKKQTVEDYDDEGDFGASVLTGVNDFLNSK